MQKETWNSLQWVWWNTGMGCPER